jgi:RimJ/RimL family protein N-acetyltransferase
MANTPIKLVQFDQHFLEHSWRWLNDPETKRLTMTPDFSRSDQERFFASLPRPGYFIWGVALADGTAIGAAGLKGVRRDTASYWGYIGEASFRGKGLGRHLLALVEDEARILGLSVLDLQVAAFNAVAIALYEKAGYRETGRDGDALIMMKSLQREEPTMWL